jgi:hypothetical protein
MSRLDRRRFLHGLGAATALSAGGGLGLAAAPAAATPVRRRKRLLGPDDLRLLGAFRLPMEVDGDDATFGSGLTHRYVDGEFRLIAAALRETVYEVAPPELRRSPPFARADVMARWGDVTQGNKLLDPASDGSERGAGLYGLHWDEPTSRLFWSYGDGYNTVSANDPSLGASELNDATGVVTSLGAWKLGNRSCKMTMGGVTAIPQSWADDHTGGRRLAAGFGGYFSIVALGPASMGPALAAFDPAAVDTTPSRGRLSVRPLVGYPFNVEPYTQPTRARRNLRYRTEFDGWNPRDGRGYWTWADYIAQGGVWIDTPEVHGVLFAPTLGQGRVWYENSTLNATRASHWWYVYHPDDLADVAARRTREWRIQARRRLPVRYPGLRYPLDGWANGPQHHVVGVTFDQVSNRLYVCVTWPAPPSEAERGHMIVVYKVAS